MKEKCERMSPKSRRCQCTKAGATPRGTPYAVIPTFDNSNSTLDATCTGLSAVPATPERDLNTYHATDMRLLPRDSDTCQKHDRRPTKNSRGTDAYTHRQSVKREDVSRRRWKYTRDIRKCHTTLVKMAARPS